MSVLRNAAAYRAILVVTVLAGLVVAGASRADANCQALMNEIMRLGPGAANQNRAFAIQGEYNANCLGNTPVPGSFLGNGLVNVPLMTGIIDALIDSAPDTQNAIIPRSEYPTIDVPSVGEKQAPSDRAPNPMSNFRLDPGTSARPRNCPVNYDPFTCRPRSSSPPERAGTPAVNGTPAGSSSDTPTRVGAASIDGAPVSKRGPAMAGTPGQIVAPPPDLFDSKQASQGRPGAAPIDGTPAGPAVRKYGP